MRTFYVWSGSLRGEAVQAENHWDAVERAVRQQVECEDYCVLGPIIRVTLLRQGESDDDEWMTPPYEEHFPDLFAIGDSLHEDDLVFTLAEVE